MPQDGFRPFNQNNTNTQPDGFRPLQLGMPQGPGPVSPSGIDSTLNSAIDFLRPFVGNAAGTLAAAGTSLIPGVGQSGVANVAADTQGYALADSLMQQLKSGDQKPATYGEGLLEAEKQAIINAAGNRIMSGIFRGTKAFYNANMPEIYNFKPTTSQALEAYGYHRLATASKFAEDFGASGAKSDALDRAGGAGFSQALRFANAVNGRPFSVNIDPVKLADKLRDDLSNGLVTNASPNQFQPAVHYASQDALDILAGGRNPFAKLDEVLQDPDRLGKVLAAGQLAGQAGVNVRKDLQSYQFMRMINDATTKDAQGNVRINPSKIASVWNDPNMKNSLDTLWGKQGREDVSNFMKQISYVQDKQNTYAVAKGIRFIDGGFMLGAGALTGNLHLAGAAGAFGGLFVPTAVIGNALTKPGVARVLTAMAGAEPLNPVLKRASQGLWDTIQGASVALMGNDGKKTWGTLQEDKDTGELKFIPSK